MATKMTSEVGLNRNMAMNRFDTCDRVINIEHKQIQQDTFTDDKNCHTQTHNIYIKRI